jgi:ATP-dependent helicase/nuclease subunit A
VDELARAAAGELGADAALASAAAAAVRRMLADADIRGLLGAEPLLWAGNEVPVVADGRPGRIDRLVLRPTAQGEQWWVLDYKTETRPDTDPELVAQLMRYQRAVQAGDPARPVRAAFITGDGRLLEIAPREK